MQNTTLTRKLDKYKSKFPGIEASFMSISNCHQCRKKNVVFGCYKEKSVCACKRKFCKGCLKEYYDQWIFSQITKYKAWECPCKRGICYCDRCLEKEQSTNLFATLTIALENFVEKLAYKNGVKQGEERNYYNPTATKGKEIRGIEEEISRMLGELPLLPLQITPKSGIPLNIINSDIMNYLKKNMESPPLATTKKTQTQTQREKESPPSLNIQGALEHNKYLIEQILEQREGQHLSQTELINSLSILYSNLKGLSTQADIAAVNGNVINENRINQLLHQYFLSHPTQYPTYYHVSTTSHDPLPESKGKGKKGTNISRNSLRSSQSTSKVQYKGNTQHVEEDTNLNMNVNMNINMRTTRSSDKGIKTPAKMTKGKRDNMEIPLTKSLEPYSNNSPVHVDLNLNITIMKIYINY